VSVLDVYPSKLDDEWNKYLKALNLESEGNVHSYFGCDRSYQDPFEKAEIANRTVQNKTLIFAPAEIRIFVNEL
jgi:hypothetical protein